MSSKDICQARWYNLIIQTPNCVKIVNIEDDGSNVMPTAVFNLYLGKGEGGKEGKVGKGKEGGL